MPIEYKKCFYILIIVLLITDLAILLNIPFLRQILGFLFLTILPGLLILQILKSNKLGFLEKFILTWGISIAFLMFFGLLINNLSLSLGYDTPLATIPLLISFNIAFILLAIVGYKLNKDSVFSLPSIDLSVSEKAFLIVPVLFPALGIFGMHVMNTTDTNIILMFLLFLIPIYVAFVCFFNHKFPKRFYPIVIFLISISLLLLLSLRSNHLIGSDVHKEYYFFQTTLNNLHWSIMGHSALDACLAISLLPAIYQSILNVHPEYLYKILYSLLCSVFPLSIYVISKKYVEEGYAFLTSMYFMSNVTFLWTAYNARANIAMLFFAFAMMTLFSDKIDPLEKRILFIIFMASCIVSHYSTTYIFFFVMLGTFMGIEMLSKKYTIKKVVSLTIVIMFFAMIFFWYSQVIETAFNEGVSFIENTLSNLNRFFVVELRSEQALSLLGKGTMLQESIAYRIHWILTWITFAFIGIGIATLIIRRKEMSFSELKFKKADFLKEKFEIGYFVIVLACSALLVATFALPFVSKGYGLGRLYPLTNTILAVFFVIGGIMIAKCLSLNRLRKVLSNMLRGKKALSKKQKEEKNGLQQTLRKFDQNASHNPVRKSAKGEEGSQVRAYLIILLVLIPYFLFVTGAMYNIFGFPRDITLNSEGKQYDVEYIHDQESYSAKWLENNADQKNDVYTGSYTANKIFMSQARILSNFQRIDKHQKIEGYIYLGYYNVIDNKLINRIYEIHNMTEYSDIFTEKNRIYDNGGSEVWR